jgi:SpoVK/Ycf46/Vps4 family AAA+-type ATPase
VSLRLLGYFLTWLQEQNKSILVDATTNMISRLSTELRRKGRFDEIFFADLPRRAILDIHTGLRKQDPSSVD